VATAAGGGAVQVGAGGSVPGQAALAVQELPHGQDGVIGGLAFGPQPVMDLPDQHRPPGRRVRQQRQRRRPAESARAIDPVLERAEAPALAGEGEALEQRGARDEVVVAAGKRANVLERSSADGMIRVSDGQSLAELAATRNAVVESAPKSHIGGPNVPRRICSRTHTDGRVGGPSY